MDDSGTLLDTYSTDAFGANAGQVGRSQQPLGYTGQQTDTDGLVYMRARYYDPASGRFMSRDPHAGSPGLPLSLNRFSYTDNGPTASVDLLGLVKIDLRFEALGPHSGTPTAMPTSW